MRYVFLFSTLALLTTSCASLNDSIELGAALGAGAGGVATYAAYSSTGKGASLGSVAVGAGVGIGIGVLTSYLVHKKTSEDQIDCQAEQTEMHFGDLPPSPFIVPKKQSKGGRQ